MEETTSQVAAPQPQTPPEPEKQTFSGHKAARAAAKAAPTVAPPDDAARAEANAETVEKPASSPKEPQEKQKPRNARNAEERAADLRAAGRHKEADKILADDAESKEYEAWKAGKADREREAAELRELRAKAATPPPAAQPVSRETPVAPSADPTRPKLKDFLAKPENKEVDYAEVVEQWKDADDAWKESKRSAAEAQSKEKATIQEKMTGARAKYSNFDQIASLPIATADNIRTLVKEFDNGLDVLYSVGSDEKERQRILALPPTRQLIELGVIARNLSSNGTVQPPEKPRPAPPVSRTPPPPRSLGGISPKEDTKGIPTKLSEHRALRDSRRAS
jgi:hypothetical protein